MNAQGKVGSEPRLFNILAEGVIILFIHGYHFGYCRLFFTLFGCLILRQYCLLQSVCANKCCNAATCKLIEGAQCASGECCNSDTCQVKKATVVCREATNSCDLPEYCDGQMEHCPADFFVQDGLRCPDHPTVCFACRISRGSLFFFILCVKKEWSRQKFLALNDLISLPVAEF